MPNVSRSSPSRFVFLRHEMPPGSHRPSHWDLLCESGEALRTWACYGLLEPGVRVDVEPLDDHRLAYLDYEGPIAGDRGNVWRFDRGTWTCLHESSDLIHLRLDGAHLHGEVEIARSPTDQRWYAKMIGEVRDERATVG